MESVRRLGSGRLALSIGDCTVPAWRPCCGDPPVDSWLCCSSHFGRIDTDDRIFLTLHVQGVGAA